MLGLSAVGICLMLGLMTRLAALGGVGLLCLYYFCMPPWPGLPESPLTEGHYLIINKNVIEALALLMIAASRCGRWAGLDAFISAWFRPSRGPAAE
jgi:thiosulfate dehydrogenase [quinone] large subunit